MTVSENLDKSHFMTNMDFYGSWCGMQQGPHKYFLVNCVHFQVCPMMESSQKVQNQRICKMTLAELMKILVKG